MDKYNERLVKGKAAAADRLWVVGSVLLILVGIFIFLMVNISFGVLVVAAGIFATSVTIGNLSIEYEYTLTNGDIDIAKIIAMKKRKAIRSIKVGDILCMDRSDSNKVTHDMTENPNVIVRNYTSGKQDEVYYAVYTSEDSRNIIYLFDFDEKCVEHLKFYLKTKSLV